MSEKGNEEERSKYLCRGGQRSTRRVSESYSMHDSGGRREREGEGMKVLSSTSGLFGPSANSANSRGTIASSFCDAHRVKHGLFQTVYVLTRSFFKTSN